MPTLHTEEVNWDQNVAQLQLAQDLSEERWRQVLIRITAYQQQIKVAHHKMKPREFQIGDLVLMHIIRSTAKRNTRKLKANWEGPYIIVAKEGKGSYTLATPDEVLGK